MAEKEDKFLDKIDDAPAAEAAAPDTATTDGAAAAETADKSTAADPAAPAKKTDPANAPGRPDGYVPKQALDEARAEARAAREERARTEANLQKFLDRFHAENAPPQTEQDFDLGPDPDTDPLGAIKWSREQRERDLRAWQNWEAQQASQQAEQTKTQERQAAEAQEFYRDFNAASGEWTNAVIARPELGQIRDALLNSFAMEFNFQEGLTGADLTKRVLDFEKSHAVHARRKGIPIDEYLVRLAASRNIGLPQRQTSGQAAPDAAPSATATATATEPAQVRDPATGQFTAADKAKKIAEAQERNMSLSDAPGGPVKKMDAKEFAKLPEEQQWEYLRRNRRNREFDKEMNFR